MNGSNNSEIEFIVDNSHYFISLGLVKAFSSVIREKFPKDDFVVYEFENLRDPQKMFSLIISLFYGQEIDINQSNAFFLGYVADTLGISLLSEATNSYRQIQLTTDNIFNVLNYLDAFRITESKIIKFAGENWPILSKSEKSYQLSFFILDQIFSQNPHISADFDFILNVIDSNSNFLDCLQNEKSEENFSTVCNKSEYVMLFKYCDFTKLTSFQLNELFEYVSFDSFPPQILKKFIQIISEDSSKNNDQQLNVNKELSKPHTNSTQPSLPSSKQAQNEIDFSPHNSSSNQLNNLKSANLSQQKQQTGSQNSFSGKQKQTAKMPNQSNGSPNFIQSNTSSPSSKQGPNIIDFSPRNSPSFNSSTSSSNQQSNSKSSFSNQQKPQTSSQTPFPSQQKQTAKMSNQSNSSPNLIQSNASSSASSPSPSYSEITIPAFGVNGSRRSQPPPVLPPPGGSVTVNYENGYELRGAIWLFQECPRLQKNSLWKKEVDLIVPPNTKGEFRYCLFDHSPRTYWCNYNGKNCPIETAWVIVGFPNCSLALTYYTIAARGEKIFYSQPMSWKIYGSDDPQNFDEKDMICYVKNAPAMNIPRPMRTFEVEKKARPYSYFKFVMLKNFTTMQQNQGELALTGIELFGVLTVKK